MSNRGRIALIVAVALVALLFFSARGIAGFYTDFLWFDALGYSDVFTGVLGAKIALAVIFTLGFAVLLAINLWLADRLAPPTRAPGPEEQFIERYQQLIGRRAWTVRILVALLFGLVAGVPVASQWRDWLLFTHPVSFGVKDPLFGTDVGFYVFRLPFLTFLVDWLFAAIVIILIVTTVAHYLNGGIRLQVQGRRVTPQVKLHLSVLLAALALLRAGTYVLERYELLSSTRGFVDGASYTDVKAQLPALNLLVLISLLAAVLLIINVWQRGWRLPVIAVGLWGLVAVVAGTVYPAFVQRFQVQPAESTKERPYIERNIAFTRRAMGLNDVTTESYPVGNLDVNGLEQNLDSVSNVRLLDPIVNTATFQRLQGLRGYYRFNELDVDRYTISSTGNDTAQAQQVVIAARELNSGDLPDNSWENRHLAYTHGYGVGVAPASKTTSTGQPAFLSLSGESGDEVRLSQPEVYFGEDLDSYAVVATKRDEISYGTEGDQRMRYSGTGGVKLDSRLRRLAFALRFGETNLFVSGLITNDSRILYVRDVRSRVQALAPFLQFDADPYPVIDGGRLKWILDGYTTTDKFPYAEGNDTSQLDRASGLRGESFNYVRNSVKAVVDAYDGNVDFYIVDEQDPIIRSYKHAFPHLFKSADAVPESLAAHFRYPEDLFRLQTAAWARYHIEDPRDFYNRDDAWNVAQAPPRSQQEGRTNTTQVTTATGQVLINREDRVAPYYTELRLPGDDKTEFVMLRTFVPFSDQDSRKELAAFMTVSSDPQSYGKLRVFRMTNTQQAGPSIVASDIQQRFAPELTLLDQQGSRVNFGDLQLLPIGNSLVYVRPWFVEATGQTPVPEMRYVTVTYNKQSFRGSTLEEALKQAFPGFNRDLGTVVEGGTNPSTPPISGGGDDTGGGGASPPTTTTSVEDLLSQAQTLYDQAQTALTNGDLGTYQDKLEQAYKVAAQAASLATGSTVAPTTSPSPTTTASA
jgi:uncharacterized protein